MQLAKLSLSLLGQPLLRSVSLISMLGLVPTRAHCHSELKPPSLLPSASQDGCLRPPDRGPGMDGGILISLPHPNTLLFPAGSSGP